MKHLSSLSRLRSATYYGKSRQILKPIKCTRNSLMMMQAGLKPVLSQKTSISQQKSAEKYTVSKLLSVTLNLLSAITRQNFYSAAMRSLQNEKKHKGNYCFFISSSMYCNYTHYCKKNHCCQQTQLHNLYRKI